MATVEYLTTSGKNNGTKKHHSDYVLDGKEETTRDSGNLPFNLSDLCHGVPSAHAFTRVAAFSLLIYLIRHHSSSSSSVLRSLTDNLLEMDVSSAQRRGAHFANSMLHRKSHRVWQGEFQKSG
jgi:hypothetical protein